MDTHVLRPVARTPPVAAAVVAAALVWLLAACSSTGAVPPSQSRVFPSPPARDAVPHLGYQDPVFFWGADQDGPLVEISGAAAGRDPQVLWLHNDSPQWAENGLLGGLPDPFLADVFAVDVADGTLLATIRLTGALNLDWEDMARGPAVGSTSPSLFLADVGDNALVRGGGTVYVIDEPVPEDGSIDRSDIRRLTLSYPDGPRNVEAFVVHPVTGDVTVFTREIDQTEALTGKVSLDAFDGAAIELRSAGILALGLGSRITGADWSPDGSRLALTSYNEVLEFHAVGVDLAATLAAGPTRQILLVPRSDVGSVEAVAYLHGGRDIVVLSEDSNSAITRRPAHILRERPPS
jgi:hypothetical protein